MRIALFIILGLLIISPVFAEDILMAKEWNFVAEPKLISPISEEVVLGGEDFLEFKWSPFEGNIAQRYCYDFRLYKGYDIFDSNLILTKEIAADEYSVKVEASLFEDNQVYTWSLRQVYYGGKSDRKFSSFKVIRK